jgi:hypothetical protein
VAFDGLIAMAPANFERVIRAVLQNIANWEVRLMEIEQTASPATGNKARALSLRRDMEMAKVSLRRLAGLTENQ